MNAERKNILVKSGSQSMLNNYGLTSTPLKPYKYLDTFNTPQRPGPSTMISDAERRMIMKRQIEFNGFVKELKHIARAQKAASYEVDQINWSKLTNLKCIKSGNTGVFIAQFGDGGLTVIKSVPDPTVKLMAHSILTFSKMFRTPNIAVMHAGHPEFKQMIFHMDKIAMNNEDLRREVRANMRYAFVILEEYMPGFDLSEVKGRRAEFLFHPEALKPYR